MYEDNKGHPLQGLPEYQSTNEQGKDIRRLSYFRAPVTNTKPDAEISLYDVYSITKSEAYKQHTEKFRAISVTDNSARADYKRLNFDYVTFSGVFSQRGGAYLINRSEWFCLDLDHTGTDKVRIINAEYKPSLIFVSPSGDGLKVVYRIDTIEGSHERFFTAFENYFNETFSLNIDQACKDISRACFLCHDPEPYYNPDAKTLSKAFLTKYGQPAEQTAKGEALHKNPYTDSTKEGQFTQTFSGQGLTNRQIIENCRTWTDKQTPFVNGSRNKYITTFAGACHRFGIPEAEALAECLCYQQSDFDVKEITATVKSIYSNKEWEDKAHFEPPTTKTTPQPYNQSQTAATAPEYFQTRTIGQVFEDGSNEPPRHRIFGDFLREDTNTLLYSNTNYGKSMLAFQIAVNAATGKSFENNEVFQNECKPFKVLLVDMELDAFTLNQRHAPAWKYYDNSLLNRNLHILHENPDAPAVYGLDLLQKVEQAATNTGAKLVIIDNLTKIVPDLLKADSVSIVIDTLRRIRQKTGASFLVIGHTIKTLQTTAITENSYYGSAHIGNFFTEIFYLDKTLTGQFFLKHAKTKQRNAWTDIVPILNRGEHARDGVGFTYESLQPIDMVQLPHSNSAPRRKPSEYKHEIQLMENAGISQTKIAEIFGCSRSAISQLLS